MARHAGPILYAVGAAALLVGGCAKRAYSLEPTGIKSYDLAVQKSLRSGRPMVIMVTASWCGACRSMQASMGEPGIKRALEQAVPFSIDLDSPRTLELKRRFYGRKGVPEVIMVTSEGREVKRQVGWADADTFVLWLRSGFARN